MEQILAAVVLAGLMGMLGQAVRAVAGLKKLNDYADETKQATADLFATSRFVTSLLIGFTAGIAAALMMGLQTIIDVKPDNIQVLLGIAAAGYAGTDFLEAFASRLPKNASLEKKTTEQQQVDQGSTATDTIKTGAARQTTAHAGAVAASEARFMTASSSGAELFAVTHLASSSTHSGTFNRKYNVFFDSLVGGGVYSADPDDLSFGRSYRTNNPGALNISSWQKTRPGYVSITPDDGRGNKTTIYRTPEHGVAAWYCLLADRYGFKSGGSFTLQELAEKYSGGSGAQDYVVGWGRYSGNKLSASTMFDITSPDELLPLAKAMFAHELGSKKGTPLPDTQILFALDCEMNGTLPA